MIHDLNEAAHRCGFQAVSTWTVGPLEEEREILLRWFEQGFGGSMGYLRRHADEALFSHPRRAWIKSIVVLLVRWDELHRGAPRPWAPLAASYARGADYHRLVEDRLRRLAAEVRFSRAVPHVDATILPERAIARRAGLGWIGRNRFLINPQLGGDVCIAELAVDARLPPAEHAPPGPRCGECRGCMDACPTGALGALGVDARRCVAFHTSQNRGAIPRQVRPSLSLILGCDECLRACPFGLAAPPEPGETTFLAALIAARTQDAFATLAGDGPLVRLARDVSIRNAVVVAGARRMENLLPELAEAAAGDSSPLVRGHAAWALGRFDSAFARRCLADCRATEPDDWVRGEIGAALDGYASSS